jgi:hypothetical protein
MNIMISSGAKKVFALFTLIFLLTFVVMRFYLSGRFSRRSDWQMLVFPLYIFDGKGFLLLLPGLVAAVWAWMIWRKKRTLTRGTKWLLGIFGLPCWLMIFWIVLVLIFQPELTWSGC